MQGDILSDDDWEVLIQIKAFLEKIEAATKALEGSSSCLDFTLPNFEYILRVFETAKIENADHPLIAPMINSGWAKFNKYYSLTDETHAYVTAAILNPRRNWKWLEKKWSDTQAEWIKLAKKKVQKVWETEYKPQSNQPPPTSRTKNVFLTSLYDSDEEEFAQRDEYETYCALPPVDIEDPLGWWLETTQQKAFPNLSKMAIDYLSIPAMSSEAERLFSSCKITLTDRRNRLGADLLEALECLKSWLKITDRDAQILEGLLESIEGGMESKEWVVEEDGGVEVDGEVLG